MEFETNPPSVGDRIYTFVGTAKKRPRLILAEVVEHGGHKGLEEIESINGGRGSTGEVFNYPQKGIYCHEKHGPLGH